jgi:hypothetical protein
MFVGFAAKRQSTRLLALIERFAVQKANRCGRWC